VIQRNSYYLALLVGGIAFGVIFPGIIRYLPSLLLAIAGDHLEAELLVLLGVVAAGGAGVYWAAKQRQIVLALSITGTLIAILGFTTYTMIVIRANKNLPMNENHPKSFATLVTYLNREQYGDFPMFKRRWSSEPEKAAIYTSYSSDLISSYAIRWIICSNGMWHGTLSAGYLMIRMLVSIGGDFLVSRSSLDSSACTRIFEKTGKWLPSFSWRLS